MKSGNYKGMENEEKCHKFEGKNALCLIEERKKRTRKWKRTKKNYLQIDNLLN